MDPVDDLAVEESHDNAAAHLRHEVGMRVDVLTVATRHGIDEGRSRARIRLHEAVRGGGRAGGITL